MKEITKLDNKYIVVKIEDINQLLNMEEWQSFAMLLMKVDGKRQQKGKPINDYVVLNLDDDINLQKLSGSITAIGWSSSKINKVGDIAVALINSLIK